MEELLPSEIARLVLGYIEEENGCGDLAKQFLENSHNLRECLEVSKKGGRVKTRVEGYNLKTILHEYCAVQRFMAAHSQRLKGSEIQRYRQQEGVVEKLEFLFQSVQLSHASTVSAKESPAPADQRLPGYAPPLNAPVSTEGGDRIDVTGGGRLDVAAATAKPCVVLETPTKKADGQDSLLSSTSVTPSSKRKCPNSAIKRKNSLSPGGSSTLTPNKARHKAGSEEGDSNCSLDFTAVQQAFLGYTELHQRIAENINRALHNPDEPRPPLDQDPPPVEGMQPDHMISELDQAIKSIVNETEQDPLFERFLDEIIFPSDDSQAEGESTDEVAPDIEGPGASPEREVPIKRRLRSAVKRDPAPDKPQPQPDPVTLDVTLEDQNNAAIEFILGAGISTVGETPLKCDVPPARNPTPSVDASKRAEHFPVPVQPGNTLNTPFKPPTQFTVCVQAGNTLNTPKLLPVSVLTGNTLNTPLKPPSASIQPQSETPPLVRPPNTLNYTDIVQQATKDCAGMQVLYEDTVPPPSKLTPAKLMQVKLSVDPSYYQGSRVTIMKPPSHLDIMAMPIILTHSSVMPVDSLPSNQAPSQAQNTFRYATNENGYVKILPKHPLSPLKPPPPQKKAVSSKRANPQGRKLRKAERLAAARLAALTKQMVDDGLQPSNVIHLPESSDPEFSVVSSITLCDSDQEAMTLDASPGTKRELLHALSLKSSLADQGLPIIPAATPVKTNPVCLDLPPIDTPEKTSAKKASTNTRGKTKTPPRARLSLKKAKRGTVTARKQTGDAVECPKSVDKDSGDIMEHPDTADMGCSDNKQETVDKDDSDEKQDSVVDKDGSDKSKDSVDKDGRPSDKKQETVDKVVSDKKQGSADMVSSDKKQASVDKVVSDKKQASVDKVVSDKKQASVNKFSSDKKQASVNKVVSDKKQASVNKFSSDKKQASVDKVVSDKKQASVNKFSSDKKQASVDKVGGDKKQGSVNKGSSDTKQQNSVEPKAGCSRVVGETTRPKETPTIVVRPSNKRMSLSTPRRVRSHIRALDFTTPPKHHFSPRRRATVSPKGLANKRSPRSVLKFGKSAAFKSPPAKRVRSSLFHSPDAVPNVAACSSVEEEPSMGVTPGNKDSGEDAKIKEATSLKQEPCTPAIVVTKPISLMNWSLTRLDTPVKAPIATRPPITQLSGDWDKVTGAGLIICDSPQKDAVNETPSKAPVNSWDANLRALLPPTPDPPKAPRYIRKTVPKSAKKQSNDSDDDSEDEKPVGTKTKKKSNKVMDSSTSSGDDFIDEEPVTSKKKKNSNKGKNRSMSPKDYLEATKPVTSKTKKTSNKGKNKLLSPGDDLEAAKPVTSKTKRTSNKGKNKLLSPGDDLEAAKPVTSKTKRTSNKGKNKLLSPGDDLIEEKPGTSKAKRNSNKRKNRSTSPGDDLEDPKPGTSKTKKSSNKVKNRSTSPGDDSKPQSSQNVKSKPTEKLKKTKVIQSPTNLKAAKRNLVSKAAGTSAGESLNDDNLTVSVSISEKTVASRCILKDLEGEKSFVTSTPLVAPNRGVASLLSAVPSLLTPLKEETKQIPMTPRLQSPGDNDPDTPLTKLIRGDPLFDCSMIQTPLFAPTPGGNSCSSYVSTPMTPARIVLSAPAYFEPRVLKGGVSTTEGGATKTEGGALTTEGGATRTVGGATRTEGGATKTEGGALTTEGGATTTEGAGTQTEDPKNEALVSAGCSRTLGRRRPKKTPAKNVDQTDMINKCLNQVKISVYGSNGEPEGSTSSSSSSSSSSECCSETSCSCSSSESSGGEEPVPARTPAKLDPTRRRKSPRKRPVTTLDAKPSPRAKGVKVKPLLEGPSPPKQPGKVRQSLPWGVDPDVVSDLEAKRLRIVTKLKDKPPPKLKAIKRPRNVRLAARGNRTSNCRTAVLVSRPAVKSKSPSPRKAIGAIADELLKKTEEAKTTAKRKGTDVRTPPVNEEDGRRSVVSNSSGCPSLRLSISEEDSSDEETTVIEVTPSQQHEIRLVYSGDEDAKPGTPPRCVELEDYSTSAGVELENGANVTLTCTVSPFQILFSMPSRVESPRKRIPKNKSTAGREAKRKPSGSSDGTREDPMERLKACSKYVSPLDDLYETMDIPPRGGRKPSTDSREQTSKCRSKTSQSQPKRADRTKRESEGESSKSKSNSKMQVSQKGRWKAVGSVEENSECRSNSKAQTSQNHPKHEGKWKAVGLVEGSSDCKSNSKAQVSQNHPKHEGKWKAIGSVEASSDCKSNSKAQVSQNHPKHEGKWKAVEENSECNTNTRPPASQEGDPEDEIPSHRVLKSPRVDEVVPERSVTPFDEDDLMTYAIVGSVREETDESDGSTRRRRGHPLPLKKRKASAADSPDLSPKKTRLEDPQALLKHVDLDRFLSALHGED